MRHFGILVGLVVAGLLVPAAKGQWTSPNPVTGFDKRADGVEIRQKDGVLRLEVKAAEVIHVTYAPLGAAAPDRASDNVVIKKDWPAATFDVSSDAKTVTLSTSKMRLVVEKERINF